MTRNADPTPSRTPISDGLGSDLQALGSILGSHLRGLDEHLGRQHERLALREDRLLQDSHELLLLAGVDLEGFSKEELRDLCRQHRLKGWSKLRRDPLIAFLAAALTQAPPASPAPASPPAAAFSPADACRTERLLLLLLQHLAVSPHLIQQAWEDPQPP